MYKFQRAPLVIKGGLTRIKKEKVHACVTFTPVVAAQDIARNQKTTHGIK